MNSLGTIYFCVNEYLCEEHDTLQNDTAISTNQMNFLIRVRYSESKMA